MALPVPNYGDMREPSNTQNTYDLHIYKCARARGNKFKWFVRARRQFSGDQVLEVQTRYQNLSHDN